MADWNVVLTYLASTISMIMYGVFGILCVGALWYYLFIIKKRRFWLVDVYEQKSDGKLYLVQKDRLQERKINFGKQTIYVFRHTKTESIPPPYECVRRLGNKEYCDYIRVSGEYIPMSKEEEGLPDFGNSSIKEKLFATIKRNLEKIKSLPSTLRTSDYIENKYVYIPIYKALKYNVEFKPISYDVNMMRINELDNIDVMFKKKQDFWQKYGSMIIIGGGIVMVIVITYMSFEYMQNVVAQSLGAADRVANPLNTIAEKLGKAPIV